MYTPTGINLVKVITQYKYIITQSKHLHVHNKFLQDQWYMYMYNITAEEVGEKLIIIATLYIVCTCIYCIAGKFGEH